MIVNLISLLLVAAGAAGFVATVRMQLPHSTFYSYGSEVLIYALLILTGVGLFFRLRLARVLALGWLKVGALSIILVPVALVVWQMTLHKTGPFQVIGTLAFFAVLLGTSRNPQDLQAIYWAVGALGGLAVLSYVCRRFFLHLRSEPVATRFKSAAGAPAPWVVWGCAAVYLGLVFHAQERQMLSQSSLPRFLQTRQHIAQVEKWRQDALASLVGGPLFTDGGKMFVSRLAYAPNFGNQALCLVDIATGKKMRIEVPSADLGYEKSPVDRQLSPDAPLLWARGNEILDLRTNQRRKMQVADEYRRLTPIGFLAGSKRFLLYEPENLRMHSLDVDSGAFVWSLDVAPQGGFTRDEYKAQFHGRIRDPYASALSPDRRRFAYLYVDTLYVVDTEAGKLESYPATGGEGLPVFSRESDWVITRPSLSDGSAALYDLKAKKRIPHGLKGTVLHFSSASGTIVSVEYRYETKTYVLVRTDLSDPAKPRWQIEDPGRHTHAASDDGKRIYVLDPGANRIEVLDLDAVAAGAPLPYTLLPFDLPLAERRFVGYSPDRRLVTVLHSPKMTLIRTDAGADAAPTVLDFSEFAYRPKD